MISLVDLHKKYFPAKAGCVEITDPEQAKKFFHSKCSCCWGNGEVKGTEWSVVSQPSVVHVGDKATVFVCKTSLLS